MNDDVTNNKLRVYLGPNSPPIDTYALDAGNTDWLHVFRLIRKNVSGALIRQKIGITDYYSSGSGPSAQGICHCGHEFPASTPSTGRWTMC